MSIKHCSKCTVPFECTNEKEGCWCESVFLSMETLDYLKKCYNNCLCPGCLKGFTKVNYTVKK